MLLPCLYGRRTSVVRALSVVAEPPALHTGSQDGAVRATTFVNRTQDPAVRTGQG